ncbi:cytosine/adenosine deaminase-related metal-dependent hydrolase [Paenibacillus amylolyticus]|uniref:Cytosine/adenosine deaminase-related metal-dependent hydrolase n=1 Tax=Paenibacillus amylolyticus TaxID=1451 RepID=A0AAP5GZF0_PAEAM|nr:amidohydrolase [Paenibacillus amylolyticus]MDR6723473.1 cytosine/adenosine deaminase-related metal-dependent hydrolase [Paenibacillus amylolyticus]
MLNQGYWLTNVNLEQSYVMDGQEVTGTRTSLCHLRIENGVIAEIIGIETALQSALPKYDCHGLLLLPSLKEAHIHLDKTYYGEPWQAVKRIGSIFERIEEERQLLPKLLPEARGQAEHILQLIQRLGSTHVRSHCNIEPVSGLKRLEATKQALDAFSGKLSSEIVAFPQHGLLRSDSVGWMDQAMAEGATHVGGLDPATVDGDVERSLHAMVELAVRYQAGIDIHLHERDEAGKQTLQQLVKLTEQAGLHGKVTVSHAFWFANADAQEAEEMAIQMASLGMSVASTVPIGRMMMPLPMLHRHGVKVKLGTDSLTDHWSPFGNGDQLEKAGRYAELYGYSDEHSLAQSLGFVTGGTTPIDAQGNQVWPKVGDTASFMLVHASCSAEAVARRAKRQTVWYEGQLVSGSI